MHQWLPVVLLLGSSAVAGTVDLVEQVRLSGVGGEPMEGGHTVTVSILPNATPTVGEVACHVAPLGVVGFDSGYASLDIADVPTDCFAGPVWVSVSVDSAELLPRQPIRDVPRAGIAQQVATAAAPSGCDMAGALVFDTVTSSLLVCDGGDWRSTGTGNAGAPHQVDRSAAPGAGFADNADGAWDYAGPDGGAALGSPGTAPTGNATRFFETNASRVFTVSSVHTQATNGLYLFNGAPTNTIETFRVASGNGDADKQVIEFFNPTAMWVDAMTLTAYPGAAFAWRHARLERWNGTSWVLVDEFGPGAPAEQAITLGAPTDAANRSHSWRVVTQDGVNNSNGTTDVVHVNEISPFVVTEFPEPLPNPGAGTLADRSQAAGAGHGTHATGSWDFAATTSGALALSGANTAPTADNARFFSSGVNRRYTVSSQYDASLNGSKLFDGGATTGIVNHWRPATGAGDADKQAIEFWNPKAMWVTGITLNAYDNPAYHFRHASLERWDGAAWVEVDRFGPNADPKQLITLGKSADYANRSHSWRVVVQDGVINSNSSTDVQHITEVRPMMVVEYDD